MKYTSDQIEYLHKRGKLPDWIYYQINGKTAQANLQEQRDKIIERYRQREAEKSRQAEEKALEKKLEADLEKQLEKKVEQALDELFKDFK